jgi:probable addiction module antidote protein
VFVRALMSRRRYGNLVSENGRRLNLNIMTSGPRHLSEGLGVLTDSLEPVLERGDPAEIRQALKRVARAHGVSLLSRETGLTREAIYKALGDHGNPTLDTLSRLLQAMELRLTVRALRAPEDAMSDRGVRASATSGGRRRAASCSVGRRLEGKPQPESSSETG